MIVGTLEEWAGTERASTATSSAGSDSAPMVMARLAPMPPKAVPVSRAPRASATEPTSNR